MQISIHKFPHLSKYFYASFGRILPVFHTICMNIPSQSKNVFLYFFRFYTIYFRYF